LIPRVSAVLVIETMRVAVPITLKPAVRNKLMRYSKATNVSPKLRIRSQIILLASEGMTNQEIAAALGQDQPKVGRWRKRFAEQGIAGIEKDKARPGRFKPIATSKASEIVRMTLETTPAGLTHWSRASMAKAAGVSPSTVGRIWARHGLKPHRIESFKLSNDKDFEAKLHDIVGLYLSPPEHAVVFSCDEKSQIQALDRTQPGLPLKNGRCGTMTHDYKRNGTTSLFAALEVATGNVIGTCMKQHRHEEWLKFISLIERSVPKDKKIHIICDNYATHKHAKVKAWLARRPRISVHFTPTSASWLNMVERFFRNITDKCIRRGVFKSVVELEKSIVEYIAAHNNDPSPFVWTAQACDILEKVKRCRAKLDKIQSA
jgi:transposase